VVSTRLGNAALAPFRPAPKGFDQIAPSRAGQTGQIPLGICPAWPTHDHHDLVESQCHLSVGQDTRVADRFERPAALNRR